MTVEQGNPLSGPLSLYLSDPLLPFFNEFRRAGVDLAGIERPLRAFPGRKREHGQRGCHKRKSPSLENGQPEGGGKCVTAKTLPRWPLPREPLLLQSHGTLRLSID